jgi:hypothetical protein
LAVITGEMLVVVALLKLPSAASGDDSSAATAPDSQSAPAEIDSATIAKATLTTGAAEVVKLAQAGMGEDVLLAFVGAEKTPFSLGSDQITYLNDVGLSGIVIKAMIQRDTAISAANASLAATSTAPPFDTNAPGPSPDETAMTPPPPDDPGTMLPPDGSDDYSSSDDAAYFYDALAPYGAWTYVAGLGYCWQPAVYAVDHSWQPYGDRGRWMSTASGWYWQSDYSWGWAPFHYGRWYRQKGTGWVWAPDRTWAPAWVSWRQSAEYAGWAPLPPSAKFVAGVGGFKFGKDFVGQNFEFGLTARRYIFIPIERMTDAAPSRYSLMPDQSARVYQQTTVANSYTVQNNQVVSRGVDAQQVAKVSGTELRVADIQEMPRGKGRKALEHIAEQDNKLVIYRPALPKPDVDYAKKMPRVVAGSAGPTRTQVPAGNNSMRLVRGQPIVIGPQPNTVAAAAQHKSVVLMVPDRPISPPVTAASFQEPRQPDNRLEPRQISPLAAGEPEEEEAADTPSKRHQPEYFYPQSSVLTPSREQRNSGAAAAPPAYYRDGQPQSAAIRIPPAFSRQESAPAPAPVYHPPPAESHPAPVESHPAPPPQESHSGSSSSSSSSSSSGHH